METKKFQQIIWYKNTMYLVSVEIDMSHDPDYGADADGNRGIPVTTVDKIRIKEAIDKHGKKLEMLPKDFQLIVEQQLDII